MGKNSTPVFLSKKDWKRYSKTYILHSFQLINEHWTNRSWNYESLDPDKPLLEPIPAVCEPLLSRLVEQGLIPELPDQLTVNLYLPGQGIPSHTDTHSCCTGKTVFSTIFTHSVQVDCTVYTVHYSIHVFCTILGETPPCPLVNRFSQFPHFVNLIKFGWFYKGK